MILDGTAKISWK